MAKELQHFGIPGMRWGVRRSNVSPGSSSGRKTAFGPTNADGRKVNKLFGKRNRTKIRNFFLGDPEKAVKNLPILSTKYKAMSPEEKARTKAITSKVLATISTVSIVYLTAQMIAISKFAHEE